MKNYQPCLLDTQSPDFAQKLAQLKNRSVVYDAQLVSTVSTILQKVQTDKDQALLEYTNKFDKRQLKSAQDLEISQDKMQQALTNLDPDLRQSLLEAKSRISSYHQNQVEKSWQYQDELGISLGQKITPIAKVGLYVPGGQASYPSSLLMSAIPAKIAGVSQLTVCVPMPNNEISDAVLAALAIADIDCAFSVGGAQAIAAMAYGTEQVPKVDKIAGPGNSFVTEAKKQLFGSVGIDMIAGPSEILIIADASANPDWLALDLFAQAEHDANAQSILLSPSAELLAKVATSIDKLLPTQPRKDIISASLSSFGALIKVADLDQAVELANDIAPEHLELALDNPDDLVDKINNAGAIFVGHYTTESLGDYCAGPSHVLPTSGCARFASPLGVYDFVKRTSVIKCNQQQASKIGKIAQSIATAEQLHAHAQSVAVRINNT